MKKSVQAMASVSIMCLLLSAFMHIKNRIKSIKKVGKSHNVISRAVLNLYLISVTGQMLEVSLWYSCQRPASFAFVVAFINVKPGYEDKLKNKCSNLKTKPKSVPSAG